jgi:CubicO group peptidase (beta-lactamase class C family)
LPAFRAYDQQTQDPDSIASLLFATELERPPGEKMVYSDIGAFVLGRVVERLGGARLDTLAERRIFVPLGMHETMFLPPPTLRPRIAPTEIDTLRGGLVHGHVHDERAYYLGGVAAHAGLFGSAHDLTRFAMMLLADGSLGDVRVLDSATVALFTAPAEPGVTNRALGWQTREHEGMRDRFPSSSWEGAFMSERAFGHTGFTGTSLAIDPELDLFVILLTNRVNPTRNNPRSITAIRRAVADAAVAILAPPTHSTDTPR